MIGGDVSCHFKQLFEHQDSPGYGVWSIYKFFYPIEEASNKSEKIYDAKLQLLEYSNIVRNLKNVLKGDFSWLNNYAKEQETKNKILNFILQLDYQNPIAKKFWNDDSSWQHDVKKYLKENNIEL